MKKAIIISTALILVLVSIFFAGDIRGEKESSPLINELLSSGQSDMVMASELYSRPDIILESYQKAYPDVIEKVIKQHGDWAVELHNGSVFYWANGRMLAEEKRISWEEYRPYQVYAYTGKPRDPSGYTDEDVERLRNRTGHDVRGVPQPPQDIDFLKALVGVGDRVETEASIVKAMLFGKPVNVNKEAAKKFDIITAEVEELASTDAEVKEFLDTLSEVSGYSWRFVAGTNRLSNHSYGLAIDILPRGWGNKMMYWSWVKDFNDDWMLVPQEDLWAPPEKVIKILEKHGFIWGGTWPIYDTMHFEYRPELIEINKRVIFE